jgi:hypothetical protein
MPLMRFTPSVNQIAALAASDDVGSLAPIADAGRTFSQRDRNCRRAADGLSMTPVTATNQFVR